jgi:hypothetical protein
MRALRSGFPEPAFLRLTSTSARWIERARCAFGVVFLRHRIAEQRHQPVTQLFGDVTAQFRHRRTGGIQIRADQIAPLLSIKRSRDVGRTHQIAEHDGEIAAFACGLCDGRCTWLRN